MFGRVKYYCSSADIRSSQRRDESRVQEEVRQSRSVLLCNRKRRNGGRTLPSHANTESEQGAAEDRARKKKMSAWVRRLGWRVCIVNRLARPRRSPRVNGGKARQETSSGLKRMGGGGYWRRANRTQRRKDKRSENKSGIYGEQTIGKRRLDSKQKEADINNQIMERMRIRHGRTQMLEIDKQVSKRGLDIVGIRASQENEGGEWDAKLESTHGQGKRRRDRIERIEGREQQGCQSKNTSLIQ